MLRRPSVFVSRSLDAHFNLAWEDFLLRTAPSEVPVCFLYRNAPCVVVGRNQNIWTELDARAMHRARIPVVRRRSGGGTVYHDEGNVNFSFHVPRCAFARHTHTELVAHALARPPVGLPKRFGEAPVQVNDRNDLYVYARDASNATPEARRKVSGSAYKIISQRAYHHGTLLLDADLGRMRFLKRSGGAAITSKGIDSVPSPVANLAATFQTHAHRLRPDHVYQAIAAAFAEKYGAGDTHDVDEANLDAEAQVGKAVHSARKNYDELHTWDWVYGSSPDMQVDVTTDATPWDGTQLALTLHTQRGIVRKVDVHRLDREDLRPALEGLVGAPYDALALPPPSAAPAQTLDSKGPWEEALAQWLRKAL